MYPVRTLLEEVPVLPTATTSPAVVTCTSYTLKVVGYVANCTKLASNLITAVDEPTYTLPQLSISIPLLLTEKSPSAVVFAPPGIIDVVRIAPV